MTTRRLAAILAADVVGFSKLIGEDEAGTLAALREIRKEIVNPVLAEHGGRIFKLMGDGMLAEFPSAVQALRAAIGIQERLHQRNAEASSGQRIEVRIGVHQGDVVVEGTDLLGDGVNIAARLEALAEPGGICISGRVAGLSSRSPWNTTCRRRPSSVQLRKVTSATSSGWSRPYRAPRSSRF
jgi:adenylate cyclase